MTNEQRKELKEAIKNGFCDSFSHTNLFDFIIDNFYDLTKEEIKDLYKEFYYSIYEILPNTNKDFIKWFNDTFVKHYINNLKENTTIFEE